MQKNAVSIELIELFMNLGVFGTHPVSPVRAQSRPTDLILAADGTEVGLARESGKKCVS